MPASAKAYVMKAYYQEGNRKNTMKNTMTLCRLLGALLLTAPGARAQTPGTQTAEKFEKQIVKTVSAKYLFYLPKDYGKDAAQKWPLLIFLHGSGESGDDLEKVKAHGPPKLIAAGKDMPFVVVSPQSPGGGWNTEVLNAMLDEVLKKATIDENRIYLTGLSMGGFGTWQWALDNPKRFAAIVPICGGGTPYRARRIKDVPTWVFHGAKDPTVPVKASEEMVEAMKAAGAVEVKFHVYPDAGHDSWTVTYDNPELYTWLLAHSLSKTDKKPEDANKAEVTREP